jgi:hypothetical protein
MSGNQYKPDPRQALFLKHYLDPKSQTFSNAYQSAIKAGYEEEYAKVILSKDLDWMSESVKTESMVYKAEKNLEKILDMNAISEEGKVDTSLLKVVADTSKFITERLAKDKYSSKQVTEHTGKVEIVDNSELDKLAEELDKNNKKFYE